MAEENQLALITYFVLFRNVRSQRVFRKYTVIFMVWKQHFNYLQITVKVTGFDSELCLESSWFSPHISLLSFGKLNQRQISPRLLVSVSDGF